MKKLIAIVLVAVILTCGCAAAFARTYAYMTWNEKEQMWEIQLFDDGQEDIPINPTPRYEDIWPEGKNPFEEKGIEFHPIGEDVEYIDDFDPSLFQ